MSKMHLVSFKIKLRCNLAERLRMMPCTSSAQFLPVKAQGQENIYYIYWLGLWLRKLLMDYTDVSQPLVEHDTGYLSNEPWDLMKIPS